VIEKRFTDYTHACFTPRNTWFVMERPAGGDLSRGRAATH
jgi:hypothetical protein